MGWLRKRFNILALFISKLIGEEILILGDSHVNVFKSWKFRFFFPRKFFQVISVGGATISGLENPTSKTQAYPKFIEGVRKSKAKTVIILLGEVDTGYVIWYRAEKYKESVDLMLRQAIDNYQNFLLEVAKSMKVICISSPLPTIKDGRPLGDVAKARMSVRATQKERTDLTIKFNASVMQFCNENEITYVNLDTVSLGRNGIVCDALLNSNPFDHHYEQAKYCELLTCNLREYFSDKKEK